MAEGSFGIATIDAALAGALPARSLFAVGGRVRDEIRSGVDGTVRAAKDLDYVVVGLNSEQLLAALAPVGRVELVGASFAVVKLTLGGTTVNVALPRRERSTGTGHREFVVESGPAVSLEEDLARRDFRMNMLARAIPDGRVVDPYGGVADIHAKRIDILRAEAFREDPLRMLRAAQFAARFDFGVTRATLSAMNDAASLVTTVSAERVRDELIKLLEEAARPSVGFEVMRKGGVLPYVFPELDEGFGVEQNEFHKYDVYHHNLATADAAPKGDLLLRLASLLHDVGKPRTKDGPHFYRHEVTGAEMASAFLERLRFPAALAERATRLVRHHMYSADPNASAATLRRFVRRIGIDNVNAQFALRAADIAGSGIPKRGEQNEAFEARVRAVLDEKPPLGVKDLAVAGNDAIAALVEAGQLPQGSKGGPAVGRLLLRVLEAVLDRPELDRDAQLALLHDEAFGLTES